MERQICPVFLASAIGVTDKIKAMFAMAQITCKKEECAWYVKHEQPLSEGCAIKELSNSLKRISINMPYPK